MGLVEIIAGIHKVLVAGLKPNLFSSGSSGICLLPLLLLPFQNMRIMYGIEVSRQKWKSLLPQFGRQGWPRLGAGEKREAGAGQDREEMARKQMDLIKRGLYS